MGLTKRLLVIISPLLALMEDQIKEAAKLYLTAMQLGVHDDRDILNGQCSLVFGTPEAWLLNDKWRNMLSSEIYREKLFGIVVDEVHMTYKWGEGKDGHPAFRESFGRLEELRSLTKEGTPVLALTASADLESRRHVTEKLNMKRVTEVTVSPNRPNIRLGICHVPATTNLKCLHWVVKEVLAKGLSMSPIIIYCRTLKAIGKVYGYLRK
ncbi:ATP-dependent DNA helicase RecQ-like [Epinephelus moara]|uniref:ATP-dependent DNA helicase RecQ-like n=1 Tax=Epinephelus moara TaxID=300413 RepID=UPI00214EB49F|nr:ATP-dependent DNA helicase RecQ-like [Epinephelus moara]